MIVGDFNFPVIDWDTETTPKSNTHSTSSQRFLDAVRDAYLYTHVTQTTRCRHDQNPHIQDLLLTSDDDMINNIEYNAGIGLSD